MTLTRSEGAERRQALGCIGTRFKSGPLTQAPTRPRAGSAFAVRAPGGRSPLGAPPRDFLAPSRLGDPPGDAHQRAPRSALLHSQVPPVVAGGRCRSVASRASVCTQPQTPLPPCLCNASREHPWRPGQHQASVPQKFAPSSRTSRNCLQPGDSGVCLSALRACGSATAVALSVPAVAMHAELDDADSERLSQGG